MRRKLKCLTFVRRCSVDYHAQLSALARTTYTRDSHVLQHRHHPWKGLCEGARPASSDGDRCEQRQGHKACTSPARSPLCWSSSRRTSKRSVARCSLSASPRILRAWPRGASGRSQCPAQLPPACFLFLHPHCCPERVQRIAVGRRSPSLAPPLQGRSLANSTTRPTGSQPCSCSGL